MLQESGSDLERRLAHAERQLSEALERQAAADEVLRLISSSPGKLELVFQAILANGTRICEAEFGTLNLYDGSTFEIAAHYNVPPAFVDTLHKVLRPHPSSAHAKIVQTRQVVHIQDLSGHNGLSGRRPGCNGNWRSWRGAHHRHRPDG
jgi:hypothetical protein